MGRVRPSRQRNSWEIAVASYVLIDSYLDVVAQRLAYRKDAADLRDELADHLLESADKAERSGLDVESAQQSTLDRFGDPQLVAAMLAAVPTKGIDMVHVLSRSAGILAIIAAALWLTLIFFGPFGLVDYLDSTWSTDEYAVQSLVQTLTVVVAGVALIAQNLRVAGRVDALTGVVIGSMILAVFLAFAFAWFFLAWGVYFAAGLAVTVARIGREPASRGIVSVLLLLIAPILLVGGSLFGLQALAFTSQQPMTSLAVRQLDLGLLLASGLVCLVLAVGFAVLGLRLRGTQAVRADQPAALA